MTTLIRRHAHAGLQIDRDAREFLGVLTHEAVDSVGDIVKAHAIDWGRFKRNPKLLREHDHRDDIGTWDATSLRLVTIDGSPGWVCKGRLYPPGVSVSADDVHRRLLVGTMGVSIGFEVLASEPRPGGRGVVFTAISIHEASLCNLPACAQCVVVEKRLGAPTPAPPLTKQDLERLIDERLRHAVERAMPRVVAGVRAGVRRAVLRQTGRID
jgi:hypothetical protein